MVNKKDKKKKVRAKHRHENSQPKVKKSGGNGLSGFLHFLKSAWLRRFILLAIILTVLFWQWDAISSWVEDVSESTFGMLGWGLILIALAIVIIIGILFRRQLSEFATRWKLYQWNKWLGATALFFGVWGVLALFELGGSFGQTLVGSTIYIGVLRVIGFFLLAFMLIAPLFCWRCIVRFFRELVSLFKMPPPPPRKEKEQFQPPLQTPVFTKEPRAEETAPRADKIKAPSVLVPPEIPLKEPAVARAAEHAEPAVSQPKNNDFYKFYYPTF